MKRTPGKIIRDAMNQLRTDVRNIRWAILIIIIYVVFMQTVFHRMCPVTVLIGYPCPACGLTRAGKLFLELNFAEAFQMHPFIFPIAGLAAWYCAERYILLRQRMSGLLRWMFLILLISAVLFYLWRMYRYFPGQPPMSYDPDCIFRRFMVK